MLRDVPATGSEDGEGSGAQECRNFWKLENPFSPGTSEKKTLLFFFLLATLHDFWDLGSLTRDGTRGLCSGSCVLPTGQPGKFPRKALWP